MEDELFPVDVAEYMQLSQSEKKRVSSHTALALLHDAEENGVNEEDVAFFEEAKNWSMDQKLKYVQNGEVR